VTGIPTATYISLSQSLDGTAKSFGVSFDVIGTVLSWTGVGTKAGGYGFVSHTTINLE